MSKQLHHPIESVLNLTVADDNELLLRLNAVYNQIVKRIGVLKALLQISRRPVSASNGIVYLLCNREGSQAGARRIQDEIFGWAVDLSEKSNGNETGISYWLARPVVQDGFIRS
jgi:hypothetical protein